MIDRRTKNAEIFRDTERRYMSDPALMSAVQQSTNNQVFIAESENITVPSAYKTEKAKVVVSGKRSLEAAEVYAKQGKSYGDNSYPYNFNKFQELLGIDVSAEDYEEEDDE
jgi:hypothetical protein